MDILLTTLCRSIAGFLKVYMVALTIRVYVGWFPNINLFVQPFATLSKMTDPYLKLFRNLIPPLLGFDLSPLIGFSLITSLIDIFSSVDVVFN